MLVVAIGGKNTSGVFKKKLLFIIINITDATNYTNCWNSVGEGNYFIGFRLRNSPNMSLSGKMGDRQRAAVNSTATEVVVKGCGLSGDLHPLKDVNNERFSRNA